MEKPDKPHRRSIRLQGFDYSSEGAYFVTICTRNRACLFGNIVGGEMCTNRIGHLAETTWSEIPNHFPQVVLDSWIVMPNHLHGVLFLTFPDRTGAACRAPTPPATFGPPASGTLSTMVRSFKSAATKRLNEFRGTPGSSLWQRNYHEHIIRNDDDLGAIRKYIQENPARWALDEHNPDWEG